MSPQEEEGNREAQSELGGLSGADLLTAYRQHVTEFGRFDELERLKPTLQIKPLRLTKTPVTAYSGDAGIDLEFAPPDGKTVVLAPGGVRKMATGIALAIPEGYCGLVLPRSSLAFYKKLAPVNSPGLIDSGYRGEVFVPLMNHGIERQIVGPGERIAQLVIVPFLSPMVEIVKELDETDRGEGGFGSSGR